jgi:hypothetical protein
MSDRSRREHVPQLRRGDAARFACVAVLVAIGAGLAQPPEKVRPDATEPWAQRLAALDPSKPDEYFRLGEEVAAESSDRTGRDLARQLFVLAFELDRRESTESLDSRLGPSVCLALASLAASEGDRRWLRALARLMEHGQGAAIGPIPDAAAQPLDLESAAFNLATAIGLARAGEGRRAEQYLERPGVRELVEQLDGPSGPPDGHDVMNWLRRSIRDWPACPQCRNQRVIPSGNKPGERVLCDTCRGNPGPALTDAQLVRVLRIEAMLVGGRHRSWSGQVIADGGVPLRDLDPAELAGTFGVDSTKPYWRDGGWVSEPAESK